MHDDRVRTTLHVAQHLSVGRGLGERVGRILNQHFTTGTGTAQPDGIVTSSTVAVTGSGSLATTGGVSYDNLVDIVEAIDALIEDATLIWHNARNSDETYEPLAGKHFDRLMELKGVRQNAAPEHLHPRPEDFVHALPHEMGPR